MFKAEIIGQETVLGQAIVKLVTFEDKGKTYGLKCGSSMLYQRKASGISEALMRTYLNRCTALFPIEIRGKVHLDKTMWA